MRLFLADAPALFLQGAQHSLISDTEISVSPVMVLETDY